MEALLNEQAAMIDPTETPSEFVLVILDDEHQSQPCLRGTLLYYILYILERKHRASFGESESPLVELLGK
jgi:hypothetical protein